MPELDFHITGIPSWEQTVEQLLPAAEIAELTP